MRRNGLVISTMENTMDETIVAIIISTNIKLVPQRGWYLFWRRTFSTVSSSPAS